MNIRPFEARASAVLAVAIALAATACSPDGEVAEGDAESPVTEGGADAVIEDIAVAHPDEVRVAFENEYVRVLRFDVPAGAALPAHEGRRRVVYALGDYELEWAEDDEAPQRRGWTEGDVHVHDAGVHALRNVGTTTASFVVFERLDTALPAAAGESHSPADLPNGARLLLTEPDLQVLEVELAPGDGQTTHPGGWRVIYSLTDYTIEWEEGDEIGEPTWSAGDAHWHEPGPHRAENVGDSTARWVIVTFES